MSESEELKLKNVKWNETEGVWRGSSQKGNKKAYGRGNSALECAKRLNFDCEAKGMPLVSPSVGSEKPPGRGRKGKIRVVETVVKTEEEQDNDFPIENDSKYYISLRKACS